VQILACVLISIIPHVTDSIIVSFATLPLVTGIAHIIAGFVQTQLNDIAYYQQSIIVWMAAMSFGPAAIAWLRRAHGRTDKVFFIFTILYAGALFGFTVYTHAHLNKDPAPSTATVLPLECFLDSPNIPFLYKYTTMKTLNLVTISVSVGIIVTSGFSNLFYKKYHPGGAHSFFASRPKLDSIWEKFVVAAVVLVEVLLFVLVWETADHYRSIVDEKDQRKEGSWSFGQIIPFTLLIYPILMALRALMEGDIIGHVETQMPRTSTVITTVTTDTSFGNGTKFGTS
jgi:hypothetical protein